MFYGGKYVEIDIEQVQCRYFRSALQYFNHEEVYLHPTVG